MVVCEELEHARLVNFDNMTIRVMQEHLVPTWDSPATIVRISQPHLIASAHEAFDVVRTEAEVTTPHWIDKLLHLEASVKVPFRPMELDIAIGQKVHSACVRAIRTISTDDGVICIVDGAKLEERLVELGQPRQVVRADVHVVKLEVH